MKSIYFSAFFSLLLLAPSSANAAGAMLRIVCDDAAAGAEVYLNGKFKGECPVDIQIPEGKYKLKVVKEVDASHERIFEQDLRLAEGTAKRVEAVLSAPRLNASAQKLADAKNLAEIADGMVVIPAGSFEMGSTDGDADEKPVHRVTIAQAFALGKTEVTQGQWKAVMGNNPSYFKNCGDNCPVEQVSWNDVQEFIRKLNASTGKQYRLPSEAEWEYACRAGGQQQYCGSDNLDSVAWHGNNSVRTTHPVAQKQANAFGLYDMSGNVWEWVADGYHDSYHGAPSDGGAWQGDGDKRLRGGSWIREPQSARSAFRSAGRLADRDDAIGFRLARMLP